MATTITPVTLTSTITESVSLNDNTYGNSVNKTTTVVGKADQRIMGIGTTETTILALGQSDSAGQIISDDLKYLRITNLDDTNSIQLCFKSSSSNYSIQLEALDSYVIMSNQIGGVASTSIGTLADCILITGKCTVACDIEYLAITE